MKPRVHPSQEPHACVVLGIDTAQVSGWCINVRGHYVRSGELDMLKARHLYEMVGAREDEQLVCDALALGRTNNMPVVLVYEKPFGGTGQGQYIGAWKAAWAAAGGVKTRFVGVYPAQWRARVLGSRYACAKREEARRVEREVAQRIAGHTVGPDEAPAICIAKWGSHAGEVLKKLPLGKKRGAA